MAFKVEIELVSSVFVRNDAKGKAINLDLTKVPANVIADLVVSGATVILNNTYNGGGKEKAVADKEAALLKRLDSWYKGNFTIIERAENQYTAMREQYASEQAEKFGRSRAQVDKVIKDTVEKTLGKEASATFSNFLLAVATQKFEALDDAAKAKTSIIGIREEIERGLAERTAEAEAKRKAVADSLEVPADLGL